MKYYAAETKILNSQSYKVNGRESTRADLADIRAQITKLENQIEELGGTSCKNKQVVFYAD